MNASPQQPIGLADDGHGGMLVGVESMGQIQSSAGTSFDASASHDVPLVVYGGDLLTYSVSAAAARDGHLRLTVGNSRISQVVDLDAGQRSLKLDFSSNKAGVKLSGTAYGDEFHGGAGNDTVS